MIFSVDDWVFNVDVENTQTYTRELLPDHCECGYCRNYYSTVSKEYPALKRFIEQFGSDIEAPVDFLPVEPTVCIVSYAVSGSILQRGSNRIQLNGCALLVQDSSELDYELKCQKPYFVFTTDCLVLPWILEEDQDEVLSPANEPDCMERMWRKLLEYADNSPIPS